MTLVSNQDRVASSVSPSNFQDVYRKLRIGDSVGVQQSNSKSVPSTQRFVGNKYFPKSVPRSSDLAFRRWLTSTRVVVSASPGFSTPLGNALNSFYRGGCFHCNAVSEPRQSNLRHSLALVYSRRYRHPLKWIHEHLDVPYRERECCGKCSFHTSSSEDQKWTSLKVSVSVFPELFVLAPSSSSSATNNRVTSVYVRDGFNLC